MKPFITETLTIEEARTLRDKLLKMVEAAVKPVEIDRRDPWPNKPQSYIKGDTLSRGDFGIVKAADCYDSTFAFGGNESRRCVVKTIYFRKRLEGIFADKVFNRTNQLLLPTDEKVYRFLRRTFMEIYVLTRCRHENIMHSHAVFFADSDLNIVVPRMYVLHDLIDLYRERYNAEPIPIGIIARILRQLCLGLHYLQKIGIMHRDVQPENIFLTRNGTVKLGHFGQSRALLDSSDKCVTPVGKEEFMTFEKLYNLEVSTKSDCLSYDYSADIWSLGVLVLQMTTFYPNEQFQKLPRNFAALMREDHMPFGWLTTNRMQLRSRLVKSGGEELKAFLSDKLLGVEPKNRPTALELLNTKEIRKWCSPKIESDKMFLRKKFIDDLDFANQFKLEADGSNYDCLESKDIPAEFYWDDSWKRLEEQSFAISIETSETSASSITGQFCWGDPSPLFGILHPFIVRQVIELSDLLVIEPAVDALAFALIEKTKTLKSRTLSQEASISLPPSVFGDNRTLKVTLKITSKERRDSLGWSTQSDSEPEINSICDSN